MKLSRTLQGIRETAKAEKISVAHLLQALDTKGHSVLIAVFTLPFLQPVPTMGLSAPFGFIIGIIGFWLMLGKAPWIPQRFQRIELGGQIALKSIEMAEKLFSKIEKLIKPRALWMTRSRPLQMVVGLLILLNGFFLALPIPIPGTNSAPAWSLLAMALANIEEDGALLSVGMIMGILSVAFLVLIILAPIMGFQLFQGAA
jgi:hypothetical protein